MKKPHKVNSTLSPEDFLGLSLNDLSKNSSKKVEELISNAIKEQEETKKYVEDRKSSIRRGSRRAPKSFRI